MQVQIVKYLVKFAALSLVLSGCAPPSRNNVSNAQPAPIHAWSRANTTQDKYMKDRYDCITEARQQMGNTVVAGAYGSSNTRTIVNGGIFTSCLGARGYIPDPNGTLVAPRGTEFYTE
jgi:hypothetical protein